MTRGPAAGLIRWVRNTIAELLDLSLSVVSRPQNQAASILPSTSKVKKYFSGIFKEEGGQWRMKSLAQMMMMMFITPGGRGH